MTKEIADAFGLQPGSLVSVVDDEQPDKPQHCQACAGWAKKYAELETVLSARDEFNRIATQTLLDSQDYCV